MARERSVGVRLRGDDERRGGTERIADADMRRSMVFLLLTVFFYYMSYNGMTTNISRYAGDFFSMGGGSYAIINITTIAGALASYVPVANLSLKYGRKRVALITGLIMAVCPIAIWLAPGFHPALYGVFLLMGVGLGAVDICVYPMILENCSANSIGRYAGYYYTVSMAAQVVTPILSGAIMDVAEKQLFLYIAVMGDEAKLKAFEMLRKVRECGISAEADVVGRGLRAQMKYADKIGARFSMVLGDNEIAENRAKVKNMESGEQTELALDESFAEKFSVLLLTSDNAFAI